MKKIQTRIVFLVLVFAIFGCKNSVENKNKEIQGRQKCKQKNIQELKRKLIIINRIILKENPILIKNHEAQSIKINIKISSEIDSIFSKYCQDIEKEIEFKKFALIYLYNFKFNQYKYFGPGETELIGASFMNTNYRKRKNPFGITLKYLLRENGISKEDIVYNGFNKLQINFSSTIKSFENDSLVIDLIKKADKEMDKAYQINMKN